MRLPRLRLRTLLIAVAVLGVVLEGGRASLYLYCRWYFCRNMAASYQSSSRELRLAVAENREIPSHCLPWPPGPPPSPARLAYMARLADCYDRMAPRYDRAAWMPWLPIPTDPWLD